MNAEVDVQLAHAGPHPVPPPPPGPAPVPPLDRELRDGKFMEQRLEEERDQIESQIKNQLSAFVAFARSMFDKETAVSEAHQQRIDRFWTLYLRGQGGPLARLISTRGRSRQPGNP